MTTKAAAIRLLVLDVDGVLTDGRLYYDSRGETLKVFNVRDGYGIKAILREGIEIAVISGRKSRMVAVRCRELGIRHVFQGVEDKVAALTRLCSRLQLQLYECACVGDDAPDIPLMQKVALSFAVADAHPDARKTAHAVTKLPGGQGAVREVCDMLLAAKADTAAGVLPRAGATNRARGRSKVAKARR